MIRAVRVFGKVGMAHAGELASRHIADGLERDIWEYRFDNVVIVRSGQENAYVGLQDFELVDDYLALFLDHPIFGQSIETVDKCSALEVDL